MNLLNRCWLVFLPLISCVTLNVDLFSNSFSYSIIRCFDLLIFVLFRFWMWAAVLKGNLVDPFWEFMSSWDLDFQSYSFYKKSLDPSFLQVSAHLSVSGRSLTSWMNFQKKIIPHLAGINKWINLYYMPHCCLWSSLIHLYFGFCQGSFHMISLYHFFRTYWPYYLGALLFWCENLKKHHNYCDTTIFPELFVFHLVYKTALLILSFFF